MRGPSTGIWRKNPYHLIYKSMPRTKKTTTIAAVKKPKVSAKPAQKPVPKAQKPVPKIRYYYANGKRKTAVACVKLYENGNGVFTINKKSLDVYFPLALHQQIIKSPLKMTDSEMKFDVTVKVEGGGVNSQAEAIRHGVSKALTGFSRDFRPILKRASYLTRDARMKERKKYGLKRARRAPQFSKR